MIPREDLFLLGVLNSSASEEWLRAKANSMMGGALNMHTEVVNKLPIPRATESERSAISELVQSIFHRIDADAANEVSDLESELDRRVEFLYFGEGDSYEEAMAKDQAEIRMLLRRPAEDVTLEFKETLWHDVRLNATHPDRILDVAKAIVAMLNRDGGTILIGVTDDNQIVGIERDLAKLESPDKFQRKLAEPFGVKLRPDPSDLIRVRFIPIDGTLIARVDVRRDTTTMYTLNEKVYIRRDGESRELAGVDLAHWWTRRQQGDA